MSVELKTHNKIAYESIKKHLEESNKTCAIHATGTGKSFLALKFFEDNINNRLLFLAPTYQVLYQFKKNVIRNILTIPTDNLNSNDIENILERYLPNMTFELYLNVDKIANNKYDNIVMDEFHRTGAKEWYKSITKLLENNKEAKILGITATPKRYLDNNKDMSDIIFNGNIASELSLVDAICKGILPAPTNVNAIYSFENELIKIQNLINLRKDNKKEDLQKKLDILKKQIDNAEGINDIFKKYMPKPNGKYIVFCKDIKDLEEKEKLASSWFSKVNSNIKIYDIHSNKTDKENNAIIDSFEHSNDDSLKLLYSVEMLNEGLHVDDIDGVIMLRPTQSPIIYLQQLGRALSAGKTNEPLIFDVVNNIINLDYIYEIKKEIENRANSITVDNPDNTNNKEKEKLENILNKFKIFDDLIDLKNLILKLEKEANFTWEDYYKLAKAYYEHKGNLEISINFKTTNGYEYDENGVNLGIWIATQRKAYKGKGINKITPEQIDLLNKIGMRWDNLDLMDNWMKYYNLAKTYYEHKGNLEISINFKTINGYEYDENGVALGQWIVHQRKAYKGKGINKITPEQIDLLNKIGMRWDNLDLMDNWMKYYNLAKAYYEHKGNLEISRDFKTTNGYEHDENGVALGNWINNQRQAYKGKGNCRITREQIKLLEDIGITWFGKTIDNKLQQEEIATKNTLSKQKEILNRFYTLLNKHKETEQIDKESINNEFLDQLNNKLK